MVESVCFMLGTNRKRDQSGAFSQKPMLQLLVTHHARIQKLSDKSQLAIRDSVESERPPAHAFVGTTVGHLPSAETNDRALVLFLIDKKMLRGAEDLVNGFVAVFADIGNTFKRSKNFADHIFYRLRLSGNEVVVKGENFAITFGNNSGRLKTFLGSGFGDSHESSSQTFASVRKNRDAVARFGFDSQFVFHGFTLTVRDEVGNNFFCLFDTFFVEVVQLAPIGLVIHQFVDAPFGVAKGDLESHDVVDVNFSFDFHA